MSAETYDDKYPHTIIHKKVVTIFILKINISELNGQFIIIIIYKKHVPRIFTSLQVHVQTFTVEPIEFHNNNKTNMNHLTCK